MEGWNDEEVYFAFACAIAFLPSLLSPSDAVKVIFYIIFVWLLSVALYRFTSGLLIFSL
jgi:hypothetical protein